MCSSVLITFSLHSYLSINLCLSFYPFLSISPYHYLHLPLSLCFSLTNYFSLSTFFFCFELFLYFRDRGSARSIKRWCGGGCSQNKRQRCQGVPYTTALHLFMLCYIILTLLLNLSLSPLNLFLFFLSLFNFLCLSSHSLSLYLPPPLSLYVNICIFSLSLR